MFKIHHIALSVSDIKKSIEFYNLFGFKEVLDFENEEKTLKISHLKLGEIFLELFCFKYFKKSSKNSQKLETDLPQIGVKHFGLQVKDLEKTKVKFEKKGISKNIEIKIGKTGIKYFFIQDPDGILLEFVEDNRRL